MSSESTVVVEEEVAVEETGPSRVELPTLADIPSVPYEETGWCREGYRPNYEDQDGTCVPYCSQSYTWDDDAGKCVSICSGPGVEDGKYDVVLGRCRCDNAGGYITLKLKILFSARDTHTQVSIDMVETTRGLKDPMLTLKVLTAQIGGYQGEEATCSSDGMWNCGRVFPHPQQGATP